MAFLAQYGAGFSCNSNEPEAIAAAIEGFFSAPERYARATQDGRRAIEEELNCENYVRRAAQMLGADPAGLLRTMELQQAQ
jgi:glycosyltransferase involved in cell wall biosynthesis